MYVSLSARIYLNVEALNMVESIGNYTRHRRVPVVLKEYVKKGETEEWRMVLRYVPAISGEALAHAYQEILAKIASEMGLKVCKRCLMGEFVKHADKKMFAGEPWEDKITKSKDMTEIESLIVENCVVEDIGGFLYTGPPPTKRTSRIQFSYMVPSIEAVKSGAVASEPQFHVRHVPSTPAERAQMIYYVETGSALYTFTTLLNVADIGYITTTTGEKKKVVGDINKRVEAAVKALAILVSNALFGAKRSRFTPLWKVESLVAAVSKPLPFMVNPGHDRLYIKESVERARKYINVLKQLGEEVKVLYYVAEGDIVKPSGEDVIECSSVEEVFEKILEIIK